MGSHPKLPATEVFENAHAGDACLDYQRDLREIGKYVDLDIETAGGGVIRAHRWVVEARFPVLRKLFRDNLRSQQINLSRYSTEAVEAVIDYAYGTRLQVTEDTVLKILLLGQNLNCGEIVEWCRSFICPRISETNVREVWKTANWSSDEELLRACVPTMMAHFARAPIEPLLLEVTEALGLRSLLSSKRPGGLSALSKVSALAAWVNAAPEREMQQLRTDAFPELVALINFEGVSPSEMADFFFDETFLAMPASSRDVLRAQMKRTMAVPSTSRAAPRFVQHTDKRDDAFWAVSEKNENTRLVTRVTLQPLRCDVQVNFEYRVDSCYAWHAGQIYVAGGVVSGTALNTFESGDPAKGQSASLPPMTDARVGYACVATDRFLYVLGGRNEVEGVLSSCERYSWAQGRWERIPAMHVRRQWHAAVRVPGSGLLAIGGWNGSRDLNEVELLQLNGEAEDVTSWRPMAPMLRVRWWPSACYCGGSVFVCSRNKNDFDLERLDMTVGATWQWTRIACNFTFTEDPWHLLLPLNGSLWIIGDYGGMYEVELAEDARVSGLRRSREVPEKSRGGGCGRTPGTCLRTRDCGVSSACLCAPRPLAHFSYFSLTHRLFTFVFSFKGWNHGLQSNQKESN